MDNKTFSRLQDEEITLNAKIIRLRDFLDTEMFYSLPCGEKQLLEAQLYHMRKYSEILGLRIRHELERK